MACTTVDQEAQEQALRQLRWQQAKSFDASLGHDVVNIVVLLQ